MILFEPFVILAALALTIWLWIGDWPTAHMTDGWRLSLMFATPFIPILAGWV